MLGLYEKADYENHNAWPGRMESVLRTTHGGMLNRALLQAWHIVDETVHAFHVHYPGMGRSGGPPAAVRVVAAVAEGLGPRYRTAWPSALPGQPAFLFVTQP